MNEKKWNERNTEVYVLDKDYFFSKYKDLEELVFYRVVNDKVKVKIAIPKYKEYILKVLDIKNKAY